MMQLKTSSRVPRKVVANAGLDPFGQTCCARSQGFDRAPHRFKDCVAKDPRQADKIRASVKNGVGAVVGGVVESRGGQIEGDVAHSHVGHGGVVQPAQRETTMASISPERRSKRLCLAVSLGQLVRHSRSDPGTPALDAVCSGAAETGERRCSSRCVLLPKPLLQQREKHWQSGRGPKRLLPTCPPSPSP
jgi:hypothetical protein